MSKSKVAVAQSSDSSVGARRVYVAIARTVSLPGYESVRVEYGEGDEVRQGESHDEVRDRLVARVHETAFELVEALKEQLKS
jgi:hypothetical protein